ncbi:MAG: hypothetical protein WC783_00435 [Candidatus Paceibacterota bacterium]|jgi:hypothetical protein
MDEHIDTVEKEVIPDTYNFITTLTSQDVKLEFIIENLQALKEDFKDTNVVVFGSLTFLEKEKVK